jgi:hypothetical protein
VRAVTSTIDLHANKTSPRETVSFPPLHSALPPRTPVVSTLVIGDRRRPASSTEGSSRLLWLVRSHPSPDIARAAAGRRKGEKVGHHIRRVFDERRARTCQWKSFHFS